MLLTPSVARHILDMGLNSGKATCGAHGVEQSIVAMMDDMNHRGHGVRPPPLQLHQQVGWPLLVCILGMPGYFVAKLECLETESWGKILAH